MRVNFIFRKRGINHNSIEELFASIIDHFPDDIEPHIVELPHEGASMKSIILNMWHVLFLKGIIHITGDVHYIGMIPFKKSILTIHDTNIFHMEGYSILKKKLIKLLWFTLPAIFVKKMSVISNFTKDQLSEVCPKALKKTTVIYNPVNPILSYKEKQQLSDVPKVLHIGTKAHKNLKNTVKALINKPCELLIVGNLQDDQKALLTEASITYKNYTNISFTEIKALYETCDVVSFLSYYEGFGMPIIEAQKVGRPVVTSDRCSIPEIGGSGALYLNPDDVTAISHAFDKVFTDSNFRLDLIKKGCDNVKRFDINLICREYTQLYKNLLK